MTSEHRYPLAALLPDYGRGLLGAVLSELGDRGLR